MENAAKLGLGLVAAIFAAACSANALDRPALAPEPIKATPAPTATSDPPTGPAAAVPANAPPSAPEQATPQAATPPPSDKPPQIGDACSADPNATPDGCGVKGRVALEFNSRSAAGTASKCKEARLPLQGVNEPFACVDAGMVYAGAVCIACRMMMQGWSARGLIDEMTPAQALFLQRQLGLDADRALAGAADWRRAIAAKAKKP